MSWVSFSFRMKVVMALLHSDGMVWVWQAIVISFGRSLRRSGQLLGTPYCPGTHAVHNCYQFDFRPFGGTPMSNSDTGSGVGYLAGWSKRALHVAVVKEITEVFLQLFLWDLHNFCFSSRRLQVYLNGWERKLTCTYISSSFPLSSGVQNSSLILLYDFLPWLLKQESLENSPLSFPGSNSKSFPPPLLFLIHYPKQ